MTGTEAVGQLTPELEKQLKGVIADFMASLLLMVYQLIRWKVRSLGQVEFNWQSELAEVLNTYRSNARITCQHG